MIKIKEFSKICNCSIYTLRYYDEIGLLKPKYVDSSSNYRYYDLKQLDHYLEIKEFQAMGFKNKEIKKIYTLTNQEIYELLLVQVGRLQNQLEYSNHLLKKYSKYKGE